MAFAAFIFGVLAIYYKEQRVKPYTDVVSEGQQLISNKDPIEPEEAISMVH